MRERDIHNLIEQQNLEAKQEIWEKICSQIDMSELQPKQAVAVKHKRWKWAAVALAIICVVTLSIVLPLTLQGDGVRYCDITQYETKNLAQNLQEYFSEHNSNLLYIDLYDIAEEIVTEYAHITDDPKDVVYYKEFILNGETGEEITLSIADNKTRVDVFARFDNINEKYDVGGVTVSWQSFRDTNFLAKFEYKGYVYYIQLDGSSQDRLTEIITDMLK